MALIPLKPTYGPYLANYYAKELEETQLIIFDEFPALSRISLPCILSYLRIEYNKHPLAVKAVQVKKDTIDTFLNKGWTSRFSENQIVGYCNGVFLSLQAHSQDTTLVVINPMKKECYELPPTKNWSGDIIGLRRSQGFDFDDSTECYDFPPIKIWPHATTVNYSCGLGFDDSTVSFKIVCIMRKKKFDEVMTDTSTKDFCTLMNVFGTDSWREIPNPPYYRTMTNEGVLAHGCLHWYAHCPHQIICFDLKKEEFTSIDPPKHINECVWNNQLVGLHGELGLVYHDVNNNRMEVWILKHKKWILHCKLDRKPPIPNGPVIIKVLGCGNKDGEILMTADPAVGEKRLLLYNWKKDDLQQVIINREDGCNSEIRLTCIKVDRK